MADVSQVKINNVTYNIKDTTARTTANGKVSKSGDTMTDNLTIAAATEPLVITKNTSATLGNIPAQKKYFGGIGMKDSANVTSGWVESSYDVNGDSIMKINTRNVVGGAGVDNVLDIVVKSDGTRVIRPSHPAAWRAGIGAVNIAGDTMTGDLLILSDSEKRFYVKRSDLTIGTAPASDTYVGTFSTRDSQNRDFGFVSWLYNTSRRTDAMFVSRNYVSGSNVDNAVHLYVNNDGTKSVALTDPAAWRSALGIADSGTLSYTNATKFSGTIYYRKVGNELTVWTDSSNVKLASALSSASVTLGQLPSGYRPSKQAYYWAGNATHHGVITIDTSGNMTFWKDTNLASFASTEALCFCVYAFTSNS